MNQPLRNPLNPGIFTQTSLCACYMFCSKMLPVWRVNKFGSFILLCLLALSFGIE